MMSCIFCVEAYTGITLIDGLQALIVVASKLAQLHGSGWVHRDLSALHPGNRTAC